MPDLSLKIKSAGYPALLIFTLSYWRVPGGWTLLANSYTKQGTESSAQVSLMY